MGRRIQNNDFMIDNQGSVGVLDVDTITWQSGTTVRITFNGTPDLSSLKSRYRALFSSSTNVSNDGDFEILAVNDGSDYIDIDNPGRVDATDDEATDSPATCIAGAIDFKTRDRTIKVEMENHSPDAAISCLTGNNLAIEMKREDDIIPFGYIWDNRGAGDYAPIKYRVPLSGKLMVVEEFEIEV